MDFEPEPIAAARFILSDGREFTFAAEQKPTGLHVHAVEGEVGMTSIDFALTVGIEYIDAAGRVIESVRQAATPLQA